MAVLAGIGAAFVVLAVIVALALNWDRGQKKEGRELLARQQAVIMDVINRDSELANAMWKKIPKCVGDNTGLDAMAGAIQEYVREASRTNRAEIPLPFAELYAMHMNIWSDYAKTIAQHPDVQPGMERVVGGYLSLLTHETNVPAEVEAPLALESWGREIGRAEQQINRTWRKVEVEASQYGVVMTPLLVEAPAPP